MNEFARRRREFTSRMGSRVAILLAAPERIRTNDSEYDYRQNSDFFYLTGFDEPQSVLVLAPNHREVKSALFVRTKEKDKEQWNGLPLAWRAPSARRRSTR